MAESYLNESRQYNNLNQLTEIDTNPQSYGYPVFMRSHFSATANNGQVMSVDDARQNGANIVYTYDALKRLTNATTAAWTQTIGYDGFGNITSKTVPPTSAEPAFPGAVSSKNWLAGVSYDLNGNALAVNAFALTYDVENRLATATSGTAVESYLYDESNHRVEKTIGSADYFYFYGPGGRLLTILQLWAGTTSLVANRMYFGGLLLGSAGPWVSVDVSTMTDRLGTAESGYPYGTDIGSTSASNDQPDFATYTKDATTGFEYANQRYYSAGLGRFLTVDQYGGSARINVPQSWNRYVYVEDNPTNRRDASGFMSEIIDLPPEYPPTEDLLLLPDFAFQRPPTPPAREPSTAQDEWDNLSDSCKNGLRTHFGAHASVEGMVAALNRANSNESTVAQAAAAHNIDPSLLSAIGLRESNWRDVTEVDGAGVGVGVFQLTVSSASGVTTAQAQNLGWSANYAANMLSSNRALLAAAHPNLTPNQLLQATAASYNFGVSNISGNPNTIDNGTTGNNYGSNVLQLADCFE